MELREVQALVMSLRTAVIGRRRPVSLSRPRRDALRREAPATTRRVWFDGGWRRRRSTGASTCPPARTLGPAIVEQLDATTVIEPSDRAASALGNLEITVGE